MSECPVCLRATTAVICMACAKYLRAKCVEADELLAVLDEAKVWRVRGVGHGRPGSERPLPVNVGVVAAYDRLSATLAAWRDYFAAMYRGEDARPAGAKPGAELATLAAHAMTDGEGERCYVEVIGAVVEGWRAVDRKPERRIVVDAQQVQRAREMVLNRGGIRDVCRQMGGDAARVNKRRIETLIRAKAITPVRVIEVGGKPLDLYRLGDVLDAHEKHPSRAHSR